MKSQSQTGSKFLAFNYVQVLYHQAGKSLAFSLIWAAGQFLSGCPNNYLPRSGIAIVECLTQENNTVTPQAWYGVQYTTY